MKQHVEKRMITLLLKGLVIICLFGNSLTVYAEEPDNSSTLYEQLEALESLKKQLSRWLEQEQADAKKYAFDASAHADAWKKLEEKWQKSEWHLLRTVSCQMQFLETFEKHQAGHFSEALPLYQQLIEGNCPDKVITVAQRNVCLTRTQLAIDKHQAGDFTEALKLSQQVIEKNCPNKLVISAKKIICKTRYKQAEKQQQAGNFTEALQSYQQMIEKDCQDKRMIRVALNSILVEIGQTSETQHRFDQAITAYKTALFLAEKKFGKELLLQEGTQRLVKEYICIIRYKQAEEQEKLGHSSKALHFYQQMLKEDCQVNKIAKKKLCIIPIKLAEKTAEAGHLEEALRFYQQALDSCCQNREMIVNALLLRTTYIVSTYETQQRFDKAIDILRTVLAMAEKQFRAEPLLEKWPLFKTRLCLMQYQQAERLRKENPLSENALELYQQVLEGNCQEKLILNTLSSLIQIGIAYRTKKRLDKAIKTNQQVLSIGSEYLTDEYRQTLRDGICLMRYQQAEENANKQVKTGQISEALQFYRQLLAEQECRGNKRITEYVTKMICATVSLHAHELKKAGHFSKALPLYQQVLEEHCQDNEVHKEHALLSIVDMGRNRETQQNFEPAFELYQKALSLANKHFGTEHEVTGIVLHRMANVYYSQADYTRAETLWEKVLVINEKVYGAEHPIFADTLSHLARIDETLANYTQAESRLKRARTIYETHSRSGYAEATDFVFTLTDLYMSLGDYKSAESLLTSVVDDCEKTLLSEKPQCLLIQESLGGIYLAQGESTQSQSVLKKVREIKEKLYGLEGPDVTETLSNLANFYSLNGDYAGAESLLKRVLRIRKNFYPAEHPEIADIQSSLATTVYTKLGNDEEAERLLEIARATYQKFYGPQHIKVAKTLKNLATIYKTQGDYEHAKSLYQEALVIDEQTYGPQHPQVADAIKELADVYERIGDNAYAQANSLYRRSVDLPRDIDIFNELGKAYKSLGDYAHTQAKLRFERVLAIYKQVYGSQHFKVALAYVSIAEAYERLGDEPKAESLSQQALFIAISNHHREMPYILLSMQIIFGKLQARQNNDSAAIFFAKQAINLLQKIRGKLPPRDKTLQRAFIKDKAMYFKFLIRLLIEQNRSPEALQVIQMFKEEEYFDFVQRDTAADGRTTQASYTDLEQDWANRYADITQQLATLADEKRDLERQAKRGDLTEAEKAHLAELESTITETSSTFLEELKTAFKQAEETNLAAVRKAPTQAQDNLTDLQGILRELGHGAVLVYYLIFEDQLMIMLITPDEQIVRLVTINQKELDEILSGFLTTLRDAEEEEQVLWEEGLALYELLIKPIATDLIQAKAKTLMVSLDGPLRYLPIAALHDGEQYLVERYATVMYTQAANKTLQAPPKPISQWKVAGFGLNDSSLPATEIELENIVCHDKNDPNGILPGVIYLNDNFTQQNLQSVLKEKYPLLHIASHFTWDLDTYLSSYLSLGDGSALTLADIRENYHFKDIDLLTLSACQTSVGYNNPATGREIEGLGILVQDKGANGIIATLWNVDADGATSEFMSGFYRLLTTGLSKAEALQKTQQDFIIQEEYAHPYYWAPFILMGNWLNASEPPKSLNLCSNK